MRRVQPGETSLKRMSRDPMIEISFGRPLDVAAGPGADRTASTLDLLRHYSFAVLILDQWGEPHEPGSYGAVAGPDAPTELPDITIETSADGAAYTPVSDAAVTLSSVKGSLGSRRSYILKFGAAAGGRYLRLTYPASGPTFRARIRIPERDARSHENSKAIDSLLPVKNSADRRYKALVVGDSNSVMRYGWVRGLDQGDIDVIANKSLGASHLTVAIDRLADSTEFRPDVVVLNSVVNEYLPPRSTNYDLEVAEQAVKYVQAWCAEKSAVPVFIIWPHLHHDNALPDDVHPRDFYATMCEKIGMPYIDAWAIVEELAAGWERTVPSLFLDAAHLLGQPAQVVGAAISKLISGFLDGLDGTSWGSVVNTDAVHDFQSLPIVGNTSAETAGTTLRAVETSLISKDMLTIHTGQSAEVRVPEGWDVVGYLINARACSGSISLKGKNEVRRRADFGQYQGHSGFPFVCARSLETPVGPADGIVLVSCVDPSPGDEPDGLASPSIDRDLDGNRQIEIAQLILRSRSKALPTLRLTAKELDLTTRLDLSFARA